MGTKNPDQAISLNAGNFQTAVTIKIIFIILQMFKFIWLNLSFLCFAVEA